MDYTKGALKAAEVIMNGKKFIGTDYGKKSLEGIADMIDRETAAPEMLEALKDIVDCGTINPISIDGLVRIARAAIAKAEGRE